MVFIDPAEQESWDNRRRRATDLLQVQRAQGEFARGNINQRQALDTSALTRRFDQMRERVPGQFARRGLLNSGLYKRGLERYGLERQAATANLAGRYQEMLGNSQLQQQLGEVQYMNSIGDINDAERVRRAQIAAALRGIA